MRSQVNRGHDLIRPFEFYFNIIRPYIYIWFTVTFFEQTFSCISFLSPMLHARPSHPPFNTETYVYRVCNGCHFINNRILFYNFINSEFVYGLKM
jgi:hypothetical protein